MNEYGQPIGDALEWSGAGAPEPTVLTGRIVELRPLAPEHGVATARWGRAHPELWTYLPDAPPQSSDEAAAFIARLSDDSDVVAFAIVDRASEDLLGRFGFLRIQPAIGTIEVGHVLYGPALQRTPAATEAQYLLMRHAFDELGYRRYEWKCDSFNEPSRAAALRLGFTEEGTWRNALVIKERTRDTTWFSVTDTEWPGRRAAFEAWLAEENFVDGRQVRSLGDLRQR